MKRFNIWNFFFCLYGGGWVFFLLEVRVGKCHWYPCIFHMCSCDYSGIPARPLNVHWNKWLWICITLTEASIYTQKNNVCSLLLFQHSRHHNCSQSCSLEQNGVRDTFQGWVHFGFESPKLMDWRRLISQFWNHVHFFGGHLFS